MTDDHSRKAGGWGGMGQRVPACPKAGVGELLVTLSWGWVTAAASGGRAEAPHANNFHSLPRRANPITLLDPLGPPSQPSLIPCLPLGMVQGSTHWPLPAPVMYRPHPLRPYQPPVPIRALFLWSQRDSQEGWRPNLLHLAPLPVLPPVCQSPRHLH